MSNNQSSSPRKTGQYLLMGILVLHLLGCYFMGFSSLVSPEFAFESGFQIPFEPKLDIIALVIGMELLFLGSMALMAIIWIRRKNIYGVYLGSAVGMYMTMFGIVAFFMLGRTDGLMVDTIRGVITLVFAYMAYKELKK